MLIYSNETWFLNVWLAKELLSCWKTEVENNIFLKAFLKNTASFHFSKEWTISLKRGQGKSILKNCLFNFFSSFVMNLRVIYKVVQSVSPSRKNYHQIFKQFSILSLWSKCCTLHHRHHYHHYLHHADKRTNDQY